MARTTPVTGSLSSVLVSETLNGTQTAVPGASLLSQTAPISSSPTLTGASASSAAGTMVVPPSVLVSLSGALASTSAGQMIVETAAVAPASTNSLPAYSQTDYTAAFLDLLPHGRAWPKYPESNLYQTVVPLVGTYSRDIPSPIAGTASQSGSSPRATQLLLDCMPQWSALGAAAVVELLPEWQATLGLPDPCLGPTPSIEQEVQQAVARFVALGGQSIAYMVEYAANLGYAITITEFGSFRTDISVTDTPLYDIAELFVWQVNSLSTGAWTFKTDINFADEPLGGFANTVLECELNRIAPAHTFVLYTYTIEVDAPVRMTGATASTSAGGMGLIGKPALIGAVGSTIFSGITSLLDSPLAGASATSQAGIVTV